MPSARHRWHLADTFRIGGRDENGDECRCIASPPDEFGARHHEVVRGCPLCDGLPGDEELAARRAQGLPVSEDCPF